MNQGLNDPQTLLLKLCEEISGNTAEAALRWASSGAMSITGEPSGVSRQVPVGVSSKIGQLSEILTKLTGFPVDGLGLLGERAAIAGFTRQGNRSVGGYAKIVEAADTPICINFARPDDLLLIPAWLKKRIDPHDHRKVLSIIGKSQSQDLMRQADLLGIPLGVPGTAGHETPVVLTEGGPTKGDSQKPLVLEFGSLWAGPLCGDLLRRFGCRVIKVESLTRPDGARRGPAGFFDLLNGGKESLAVDFNDKSSLEMLLKIVNEADVIIEGSRPRALRHLGIDAEKEVENGSVWVSITGYGRTGFRAEGVAFGDDAAVSGDLFLREPLGFIADAVADPSAGLFSATLAMSALESRKGWMLDVALSRVAKWMIGTGEIPEEIKENKVAEPYARKIETVAPSLGKHNSHLKNEFS